MNTSPVPTTREAAIEACRASGVADPEDVARRSWPELFVERSRPTRWPVYYANDHKIQRCDATTGHTVINIAFCDKPERARQLVAAYEQRCDLHSELDGVAAAMPVRFMDLPDGGSPTLGEQVARMRQALVVAEQQRDELLAALKALVADTEDYERVNNLAPAPGKLHCWQSMQIARAVLDNIEESA